MSKRFTAVNALLVSCTRTKDGGKAKVKFQLTEKVRKSLDWPEMPDIVGEWSPDYAELKATVIEFTPNNEELKHHATSVDAASIGDFQIQRKHKKSGKNAVKAEKIITQVICTVKFGDPTGCAKLEQYLQNAARSEMLVVYTPQPQQDELPGTRVDMTPEDSQLPLATAEQREVVAEIPDGDPNVEYVERAKERLEKRKAAKGVH
jgi:hypothetical protein